MSQHYKDSLCWRCRGNSGPSRAFAFWQIQQNDRAATTYKENGPKNGANGAASENGSKCECGAEEGERGAREEEKEGKEEREERQKSEAAERGEIGIVREALHATTAASNGGK